MQYLFLDVSRLKRRQKNDGATGGKWTPSRRIKSVVFRSRATATVAVAVTVKPSWRGRHCHAAAGAAYDHRDTIFRKPTSGNLRAGHFQTIISKNIISESCHLIYLPSWLWLKYIISCGRSQDGSLDVPRLKIPDTKTRSDQFRVLVSFFNVIGFGRQSRSPSFWREGDHSTLVTHMKMFPSTVFFKVDSLAAVKVFWFKESGSSSTFNSPWSDYNIPYFWENVNGFL